MRDRDHGSAAVELVLLTPVLVVLVLFVVAAGRGGVASAHIRHAADQGARAASMTSGPAMESTARAAALSDLRSTDVACAQTSVAVAIGSSGSLRTVTVTVSCTLDRSGLSLLGLDGRTIDATSVEVIDRYRGGS